MSNHVGDTQADISANASHRDIAIDCYLGLFLFRMILDYVYSNTFACDISIIIMYIIEDQIITFANFNL